MRQRELQAIEEPAIETGDLGLTITSKRIGGANTGCNLIFPTPLQIYMSSVESRNLFVFQANSQIQGQPARRLPFILEEDCIGRVGRLTAGAKLIINATSNDGYACGKAGRQRIKTTTSRALNAPLDINEFAIKPIQALAVIQVGTSLTTVF